MALVTVQRSPVAAECSNSDGEAEDDEGSKNEKSECFFAGKDTALSLSLREIPQYKERRLSTDSTRSTNSTQSNNSDIQQHLQSMFYLLRNEETLKMAVKLESQRPNRTRYLVIASRCCYRIPTTDRKSKVMRNNSNRSSLTALARQSLTESSISGTATTTTPMTTTTSTTTTTSSSSSSSSNSSSSSTSSSSCSSSNSSGKCQPTLKQARIPADSASGESGPAERRDLAKESRQDQQQQVMSNRQSAKCDGDRNSASGDSKCTEGIEESCLLGIDCNERTTIGLVVPILADTTIHLDGDGGFSVAVYGKTHIFKPVSVQAMWSALQTLHKVSHKARENNFYPGGPSHDWLSYYENRIESDQSCLNEWNAMDSLESRRPPSPDAIRNKPTAKEETESVIKMKLKEIMMSVDLDEVTSKYIRGRLEELLDMDLGEFKSFIDAEMLLILGQMDAPTKIFDHVYLGSEWNASNLEELQKNGVRHILNVTREIDNFFPGIFDYFNVRVYDDEKTNLLKHWDNTYRYITRAKAEGSKVLVHCKMGVSRSASVVIAYAMKAYNWKFQQALQHVKDCRSCIKPNKNFLNQLETYNGMLDAMKNKEKLQRSKSETNLKSTKDARLLPGSEPTPLIQALNQSKSKSAGQGVSGDESDSPVNTGGGDISCCSRNVRHSLVQKQRRMIRRSSSTSPKSIQSPTAIVMKQQSQSLENLTPERSVADEPRNVRYPGSNGENYSVTQNQVLHIQKNTFPTQMPPPNSVRTIVHDLESYRELRKSADDRKSLNLQFGRSTSHDAGVSERALVSPVWTSSAKLITQTSNIASEFGDARGAATLRSSLRLRRGTGAGKNVTTSSDAGDVFLAPLEKAPGDVEKKRHTRKTHSWAATSGGIVMDSSGSHLANAVANKVGSNSSIDSASSTATSNSATGYDSLMRTRARQRDIPHRHASWGSGDSRYGIPLRHCSWSSYDTNRNNFQFSGTGPGAASAIVEGQIHELNMSNKTALEAPLGTAREASSRRDVAAHHAGTVKRTKQKLEEFTTLKKLCQENGDLDENAAASVAYQKRNPSLHRSASAAGSTRSHYPHRCNSEEIVNSTTSLMLLQRGPTRRSDGSKPLQSELFSVSAPDSYTICDIENKNTLPQIGGEVAARAERGSGNANEEVLVELRIAPALPDDQRISSNVQILKKNFEAKASVVISTAGSGTTSALTVASKKGHSLPSSPVAQHVDHQSQAVAAAGGVSCGGSGGAGNAAGLGVATAATTTGHAVNFGNSTFFVEQPGRALSTTSTSTSSSSASSSSSSSMNEPIDRNVKGLVHKYQATSTASNTCSNSGAVVAAASCIPTPTSVSSSMPTQSSGVFRPRPRSCYENPRNQKSTVSLTGRRHDFSDSRPPPAPAKCIASATMTNQMQRQDPQHNHQQHPHPHQHQHQHQPLHYQQQQLPQSQSHNPLQPQRRLQQHGKTHPLARLSLPKQSFNAAAYNTM